MIGVSAELGGYFSKQLGAALPAGDRIPTAICRTERGHKLRKNKIRVFEGNQPNLSRLEERRQMKGGRE